MFRLQRFFSLTSLATLLVTAALLGLFYRMLAIDLLLSDGENKNMAITRVLANSLWPQIEPLLTANTDREPAVTQLQQEIARRIDGLKVVKVKLYTPAGLTVFSTDPAQIGQDQGDNPAIALARAGEVSNSFVERDSYNPYDRHRETQDLLQTYMPLYRPATHEVVGVFEVYSDYTPLLARIRQTQGWVMLGTGTILGLLYAALLLIVRHADRVIKAQRQELDSTVEALRQTRDELEARVAQRTRDLEARNRELAREVEERQRMEQQVIHQEKMAAVGSLAAGIVHEIGNPIAALLGLLQTIRGDQQVAAWPEELREALALAEEQAQRLVHVNRDVSEFATPDAGQPDWLDFNNLVARTCRLMRYDRRLQGVEVRLALEPQLPALRLVGSQMVQVLMNLIANAADALAGVQDAGLIEVKTFLETDGVGFEVNDNGCGMDPDTLHQAMDAFYTTKAVGKGSGLGLAISHSIVRAHRGTLTIDSEPGKGTRVTVRLPLPEAEGSPPSAA